jgi:hypothetical protein
MPEWYNIDFNIDPAPEPAERCRICRTEVTDENRAGPPGSYDTYCNSCTYRCGSCSRLRRSNTGHANIGGHEHVCESCALMCGACNTIHLRTDGETDAYYGSFYCNSCGITCRGCGNWRRRRSRCHKCNTLRNIDGYGHTHPVHWLGGPLPKNAKGHNEGYYLGFELEITAAKGDGNVLRQWAENNFGYRDALDCKMDSSVQGFEIATQPMTPEFFESMDWGSFFDTINSEFSLGRKTKEPDAHGLHVHIGRTAFEGDPFALAAFCHLIGQGGHLERIARRDPTYYCPKVEKPASAVIAKGHYDGTLSSKQAQRLYVNGAMSQRSAINLYPSQTVEIRAFRSTRNPQELKDAVRLVYVTAEYVRALRKGKAMVSPRALEWTAFARWVGQNYPDAFASIANLDKPLPKKKVRK